MPLIARYKVRWQGFSGAPGYSVFHMRDFAATEEQEPDFQAGATKLDVFCNGITSLLPATVNIQVMTDVEIIDEVTGDLQNVRTATTNAPFFGTAAAATAYAAAVGGVITWRTGFVLDSRRVRGRTFLVPFTAGAFQNDGTLAPETITTLTTAATALTDSTGTPDLGVYARPREAKPEQEIEARDGAWAVVSGFSIPDIGAVLRSRRD